MLGIVKDAVRGTKEIVVGTKDVVVGTGWFVLEKVESVRYSVQYRVDSLRYYALQKRNKHCADEPVHDDALNTDRR
jgi:hypothetical protein